MSRMIIKVDRLIHVYGTIFTHLLYFYGEIIIYAIIMLFFLTTSLSPYTSYTL